MGTIFQKMARRYDSRTTIFSPEGRLYQVEYAMEAISHAGAAVGILATNGIVLAAEKKSVSPLLERTQSSDKMYKIDDHVAAAVARITAQRYRYTYQEPQPVEQLVQVLCDLKQGYTQYGGLRPFGVSFLFAGWDKQHGLQLYGSDPSGNYGGWKAMAIGANSQNATSILKTDWSDSLDLDGALQLALKVLAKTADSTTLAADKLDFATVTVDEKTGRVTFTQLKEPKLEEILKVYNANKPETDE